MTVHVHMHILFIVPFMSCFRAAVLAVHSVPQCLVI